jgi:hypothetical protein
MEAAMKLNTFLLGFGLPLMLMLFLCHRHLRHIAADIKEIRITVVQQAKECHNLDTMEVKNK